MNRIYCAVGKIMEQTQLIEVKIGEICAVSEVIKEFSRHLKMTPEILKQAEDDAAYLKNKMESMTFGERINVVKESESLKREETNELRALLEKRNYFAHEYFKLANFGENPSESEILEEFEAIKEYLRSLKSMLSRLDIIKKSEEGRLKYLKTKAELD